MANKFSLAHLSALDLTPPELILVAAEAGYDAVGLRLVPVTPGGPAWALWSDKPMMAMTKARMADTGVGVLDVELARLEPDTDVNSFIPCFEAAAELEARHVLTQGNDPDLSRLTDRFGALCDLAADYDLTCDFEFIPWHPVKDLATLGRIIDGAARSNAGIMIDTLHFDRSGSKLEDIERHPASRYHYMQLCDASKHKPADLHGLLYAAREERMFPGEGELDLVGVLSRLPPDIPIGIEIPSETLSYTAPPEERARLAREASLQVLAEVRRLREATAPG